MNPLQLFESTSTFAPPAGSPGLRPNLIVRTGPGDDLDKAVEQIRAAGGDKVRDVEVVPFTFADDVVGKLVTLVFEMRGVRLAQQHACRVDDVGGPRLSVLSLTADERALDAETRASYLEALRSARVRHPS